MTPTKIQETDVVVIGGGPAGSTVSTVMADRGLKVELFERDRFPRFHIGESLIPETYWVLKRIGMLDKMKGSHFVKKFSVQFVNSAGKESAPFYFHDNKPDECSQTWQVVRSEFDTMMLNNARNTAFRSTSRRASWTSCLKVAGRWSESSGGERRSPRSAGQGGGRCQRADDDAAEPPETADVGSGAEQGAIWTYWKGAYRDTGRDEGATVVIQTNNKQGWFWYIPQHDDVISVGVVGPFEYLFKGRGTHEETYNEEVAQCIGVQKRIAGAERVTGYFATKDYSYRSKQAAGDGWVLCGDAFGFLDPLYSSGVLLALKGGELAEMRSPMPSPKATLRRRLSVIGPRTSTRASIACVGSSASITTGSTLAGSSRPIRICGTP